MPITPYQFPITMFPYPILAVVWKILSLGVSTHTLAFLQAIIYNLTKYKHSMRNDGETQCKRAHREPVKGGNRRLGRKVPPPEWLMKNQYGYHRYLVKVGREATWVATRE